MKKTLALILALIMIAAAFAGCGEKPNENPEGEDPAIGGDTQQGDVTPPQDDEPTVEPDKEPTYRTFDNPYQEALVLYAEQALARKAYYQYDDTRLIDISDPVTYRWQRHVMSVEDCTKQLTGYTNCAAFTHDCYYFALDYDIGYWSTAQLIKASDEHMMYYYEITGKETDEDKARIKQEYIDALEPGDIIVYRNTDGANGHAMLYVGEGKILHSSAVAGGNYDYPGKKENAEPGGTISYMTVDNLFDPGYTSRYLFLRAMNFGIVRPLTTWNEPVPEKSLNRAKNLQNVVVQKLCSTTIGQTIDIGEELIYSFEIKNGNEWKVTLDITDVVPEHTTYVSGADKVDGSSLSWTVEIPRGETVTVSYTVKVNDDSSLYGTTIFNDKATVGGVPCKTPAIYVGKHLDAAEQAKITEAVNANLNTDLADLELADKIYTDAIGMSLKDTYNDTKTIMQSLYPEMASTFGRYSLNENSRYYSSIAPTMYGGRYVGGLTAYNGVRTRGPQSVQIMTGDLILMSEDGKDSSVKVYMFAGNNALLRMEEGGVELLDLINSRDVLFSVLGYPKFVILRPAMALK